MYESTQARHGNVQRMSEYQYQSAEQPTQGGTCRIIYHEGKLIEHTAKHTACQTKSIETDVRKYIAHQSGSHVIGIPYSGTDVDKYIPMNIVQQVDTPQNLYDKPCNVFVAGFMGSPQMNLINAKVVQSGEDVVLMFGGNTVKLPEGKAQKLIEAGYVDTTVIMGIRPEDLNDSEVIINANPDCVIEATIRVYELLGAEVYLYFDIEGFHLTARVNPRTTAKVGDVVKFAFDLNKLHIFDKETEQIIVN